ncbi:MAG TPA: multiheme c-type cytochrome [Phycisphaerae bacterium]|nr:multiheme c-type cytochrome [Phycisphaerae bacterium]
MYSIVAQGALAAALLIAVILYYRARAARPWRAASILAVALVILTVSDTTVRRADARRRAVSVASLRKDLPHLGLPQRGYAAASRCQACHPSQHASWHRSYHRTMTQAAVPGAVVGDFNNVELTSFGRSYRLERRGDEFWVRIVDPDWEHDLVEQGVNPDTQDPPPPVWKRVVMTTGSHHHQTCWVGSAESKELFNVPFVWLIDDRRWAPREHVFLRPPDFGRSFDRWNDNCVECHSTPSGRELADAPHFTDTRVSELGIACEACHGPGEEHIRANMNPTRRYALHLGRTGDPTIVNPARLDAQRSAQVCGQCHGLNLFKGSAQRAGIRYKPGDDLRLSRGILRGRIDNVGPDEMDDFHGSRSHMATQEPTYFSDRFWPDGMVRVSGRDHNGLIESPCYQGGRLSCLNCHAMHGYASRAGQLAAGMDSNAACLQCHGDVGARLTEHTHHAPNSTGSLCYNCHMPHTVYGLLKNIRSHWIDSPSVAVAQATGRPNACNLCHLDRTLAWTDQHLQEWYRHAPADLAPEQRTVADSLLWLLTGDANQRAIAAWHMGWEPARQASGDAWMPPYLAHLMMDPYSAVRYISERSLRRIDGFGGVVYDFLEPPEALRARRQQIIRLWYQRQSALGVQPRAELLIGLDRQLDGSELARLASQRNNRAVDLRE